MKTCVLIVFMGLLSVSCQGQKDQPTPHTPTEKQNLNSEKPEGTWRINKSFDENGNLIEYDSIYSWSSSKNLDNLTAEQQDSLIKSFKSKFYTHFNRFNKQDLKKKPLDSLFMKSFFDNDFFIGNFQQNFKNIDEITQQFLKLQQQMLHQYQPELIAPDDDN